jgi:hypothetical protein
LEEERFRLSARIDQAHSLKSSAQTIRAHCERVFSNIEAFPFAEKRQSLQALDITVIVYSDKAVVQGFTPGGFVSQPS